VSYYFAGKMSRLIILLAPIASALAGVALSGFVCWAMETVMLSIDMLLKKTDIAAFEPDGQSGAPDSKMPANGMKVGVSVRSMNWEVLAKLNNRPLFVLIRAAVGITVIILLCMRARTFSSYCHTAAEHMAQPQIMLSGRGQGGKTVIIDDYREAYWWLRDNTPEDSRVLSWWDYGYHINGIANRTSLADGNTWNHEHIATIGKMLVSPEKEAHAMIRHVADFVLVWAGGQGDDDLAKSPNMVRVASSVFPDICPNDPHCSDFGFVQGHPTKAMINSLIFKLVASGQVRGVEMNPKFFREVYRSKHGKVRIYAVLQVNKNSKKWAADPTNRLCDRPGSWFCPGQYPPAFQELIAERKDFAQLEDFNRGKLPKLQK